MPPEGLTYTPDFLTPEEESDLVRRIDVLAFGGVRMHGVVAKRTVIHFGYDYDYSGWKIHPADPPPPFLEPRGGRGHRARAHRAVPRRTLPAGRGDRLAPRRSDVRLAVIGVSLLSSCAMHLRKKRGDGFEKFVQILEPRSLYILDRAVRTQWQHSIPRTKDLRYSITMRTVRTPTRDQGLALGTRISIAW